jgi:hypothetical protein
MLDTYLKWFESHERILIVAMVLGVSAFGLNKWLDKSAIDAASKAAVAQQVAAVQHDADVKVAAAIAQQTALFNHEQQVREQEMATLVSAIASRDLAANTKIKTVTQPKTPSQAVTDLQATYQLAVPVTVTDSGAEVPTVDLQQFTVAKIEGDTAKADLVDTRKELDTTTHSLVSATSLVGALQNQVTGLQVEIKDNAVANQMEIAALKAKARKSKLAWFKGGVVVGFFGGLVVGHYTHI